MIALFLYTHEKIKAECLTTNEWETTRLENKTDLFQVGERIATVGNNKVLYVRVCN